MDLATLLQEVQDSALKPPQEPSLEDTCEHLKQWLISEARNGKHSTTYQVGNPSLRKQVADEVSTWAGCTLKVVKDVLHISWN